MSKYIIKGKTLKDSKYALLLLFLIGLTTTSCTKKLFITVDGNQKLNRVFLESGLNKSHFAGFALFDPGKNEMIYQINADHYFVPASNTKILTLYTAMQYLENELPALEMASIGNSRYVRGNGNPAFLHPEFESFQPDLTMLQDTSLRLYYTDTHFKDQRFGNGWAWNDYPYGYQAEKSPMPLYGNVVWFKKNGDAIDIRPKWYSSFFTTHNDETLPSIHRDEFVNAFSYQASRIPEQTLRYIPFTVSAYETSQLLEREIGPKFEVLYESRPLQYQPFGEIPLDTVYRMLMRHSDNFIAEQLMLACGHAKLGWMETDSMIRFAQKDLFAGAPDPLLWYDGSGLSRYNMFTPRSIVWVLDRLYTTRTFETLKQIFPAGGESGTIRNWYKGVSEPYVFAKTGTLRNKHCLSGYLVTDSGRVLIFSFMHNNYSGASSTVKPKMQAILEYIRDNF